MKKLAMFLTTIILGTIAITTLIACAPSKVDVDIFLFDFGNAFLSNVRAKLEREFDDLGIKYAFHDGQNNQTTQTQSVDTVLAKGSKLLIINPIDATATSEIQSKVKRAGAKAIYFNKQDPDYDYEGNDTLYVGSDLDGGGAIQGQIVADFFRESGKYYSPVAEAVRSYNADKEDKDKLKEAHIHALTLFGDPAHQDAIYRTRSWIVEARKQLEGVTIEGAKVVIDYDPNSSIDVVKMPVGLEWSLTGAKTVMDTIKNSGVGFAKAGTNVDRVHDAFNIVLANNDDMALGAVESLGAQVTSDIPVIGVDAIDPAIESIKQGKLTATVEQDMAGIATAIVKLFEQLRGGKDMSNILEGTVYTQDRYKDRDESKETIGIDYRAKKNIVRLNYKEYKA